MNFTPCPRRSFRKSRLFHKSQVSKVAGGWTEGTWAQSFPLHACCAKLYPGLFRTYLTLADSRTKLPYFENVNSEPSRARQCPYRFRARCHTIYCIPCARYLKMLAFVFGVCRWCANFGRFIAVFARIALELRHSGHCMESPWTRRHDHETNFENY